MPMNGNTPRLFSGMQPSGNLHIGNYLGALKTWARIQYDYEPIFCVVDQHAITVYQEPKELQEKIEDVAALYVAAGIDPEHSAVFVQSSVAAHLELAWVFTCVTPMGWLSRMTQFKAKSQTQESVGTGLFVYPALMAADILYQAQVVPVGEDQAQHLELTRDIAQRFNSVYGETFKVPKTELPAVGERIMGLDDPTQKMSKSAPGSNHAIGLLDPPSRIKKLIGRAVTDTKPGVDFDDLGAGVTNLITDLPGIQRVERRSDSGPVQRCAVWGVEEGSDRGGGGEAGADTEEIPGADQRPRGDQGAAAKRSRAGCADCRVHDETGS